MASKLHGAGRRTSDVSSGTSIRRYSAILLVLLSSCFVEMTAGASCDNSEPGCLIQLAENAFDRGSLAEAMRHASTASRLAETDPAKAKLLLSALRIQAAIHIENGSVREALGLVQGLQAMPLEAPEHTAAVRGLSGACYQAAGDLRAAEREYLQAIRTWESVAKGQEAVTERSNLAVIYIADGRFDQAVAVLERAHALLKASGKSAAYHRLVITNNLAVAYSGRGDTKRAVHHALAAARLAEAAKIGRYAVIAGVFSNSAGVLRGAGHNREANDLDIRAKRAQTMANALVDLSELSGRKRP